MKNSKQYIVIHSENCGMVHYSVSESGVCHIRSEDEIIPHCQSNRYVHKSCRDHNSIGVAVCGSADSLGRYGVKAKTFNSLAELVKGLMLKYGIPQKNVLRHLDVTGNVCPKFSEKAWDKFIEKLTDPS